MRMSSPMLMTLSALVFAVAAAADATSPATVPAPFSAYAGRVVYVDFWASWCGPCAESFPWLNAIHDKYGSDLVVVGVNVDTRPGDADAFLKKHPARFGIVRDPGGALAERYAIEGMPSSLILDRSGKVIHQHAGFRQGETARYEAAIQSALAGARSP